MTSPVLRSLPAPLPGSDGPLLLAIAGGDLGALGVLYDRHASAVWRVVHRVTNGEDGVEDIVHAAFLKAAQVADSFDGRPSARSWLTGIAVRLALRRGRSLHRFARTLARFAHITRAEDSVDPETRADARQRLDMLSRALSKLSSSKRAVFVLVELEGLAHDEVAEALGVPLPTVRTRLFHAKKALRLALAEAP